jgi:hypothetical protein
MPRITSEPTGGRLIEKVVWVWCDTYLKDNKPTYRRIILMNKEEKRPFLLAEYSASLTKAVHAFFFRPATEGGSLRGQPKPRTCIS